MTDDTGKAPAKKLPLWVWLISPLLLLLALLDRVPTRWGARRVGIAFVVFFILASPTDAGSVVDSAFDGVESAANQLATFMKSIV